jgi:hypothetical protein
LGEDGTQHFMSLPHRFVVAGLHLGTTRWQPRGAWSIERFNQPPGMEAGIGTTFTQDATA